MRHLCLSGLERFVSMVLVTSIGKVLHGHFLAAIHNTMLPFLPREIIYTFLIALDLPFCKAYLFAQGVSFYLVAFLSSRLATTISRERVLQKEILQNLTDGVLVVDSKHT